MQRCCINDNDDVFVSFLSVVKKFSTTGTGGTTVAGTGTSGSALTQINNSLCIAVVGSTVYCSEANNHRVTKWVTGATSGVVVAGITGSGGTGANQLFDQRGVALDSDGNIYVSNGGTNGIKVWPAGSVGGDNGTVMTGTSGNLNVPFGLDFRANGSLLIADYVNHSIKELTGPNTSYTPSAAGTFTAIFENTSGCTNTQSVTINENPSVSATVTDAACFGDNGAIDATPSNGTPTYTYLWSDNSTNEDLTAVAGSYTLTVTDANSCTATTSGTIAQPTGIVKETLTATDTTVCDGAATTITTASSESGVNYSLYETTGNTVVDGPTAGTGSSLSFATGNLSANTDFYVEGAISQGIAAGVGTALEFDGADDYVTAGTNYNRPTNEVTLGAWIKV